MGYPKVWGSLDLFASLWETEIKYKILRGDVFTCGADRGQLKEFLERIWFIFLLFQLRCF